ncbi:MAG: glycine cleavage system protein H [Sandaracinaceae bacterium]
MSTRRYSPDHAWVETDGRMGLTARFFRGISHVDALHLAELGTQLQAARPLGWVEAEKGTFDIYSPLDGTVVERNEALLRDSTPLLREPERTWLLRIAGKPGRLLSAAEYTALR